MCVCVCRYEVLPKRKIKYKMPSSWKNFMGNEVY